MQNTNLTKSLTEHIQTNARGTNVPNNQKTHIQDNAQDTNVTNSQQKTYKTVRKTCNKLTRRLIPNSVRDTSVTQNSAAVTEVTFHSTYRKGYQSELLFFRSKGGRCSF